MKISVLDTRDKLSVLWTSAYIEKNYTVNFLQFLKSNQVRLILEEKSLHGEKMFKATN